MLSFPLPLSNDRPKVLHLATRPFQQPPPSYHSFPIGFIFKETINPKAYNYKTKLPSYSKEALKRGFEVQMTSPFQCPFEDCKGTKCNIEGPADVLRLHMVFEHGLLTGLNGVDFKISQLTQVSQLAEKKYISPPGFAHSDSVRLSLHQLLLFFLPLLLFLSDDRHNSSVQAGFPTAKEQEAKLLFERVTNAKKSEGDIDEEIINFFDGDFEGPTRVGVYSFDIVHEEETTKFCFLKMSQCSSGDRFCLLVKDNVVNRFRI